MAVVKCKKCSGGYSSDYLLNALKYLYNEEKALHIGGYGVDPSNLQKTYAQMIIVKRYFHKTQENPLIHLIISFGDEVRTYEKAKSHAVLISAFFKCRHQVLWAVHKKHRGDSLFHIHMIINSVSFVDGKLYDTSRANMCRLCDRIEQITHVPCRYYFAGYGATDDV